MAVTFEYDKRFRNELSTVPYLGRTRRIFAGWTNALTIASVSKYDDLHDP